MTADNREKRLEHEIFPSSPANTYQLRDNAALDEKTQKMWLLNQNRSFSKANAGFLFRNKNILFHEKNNGFGLANNFSIN